MHAQCHVPPQAGATHQKLIQQGGYGEFVQLRVAVYVGIRVFALVPQAEGRNEALDLSWIGGETGGYLNHCLSRREEYKENYPKWMSGELEFIKLGQLSEEHGSYILVALETGRVYRGHFNIKNQGLVTNLPNESTIEIPCYVDRNGIQPTFIGELPLACAATCRVSISVQEMAVEAALTGNRELVKQAVLHDPLMIR